MTFDSFLDVLETWRVRIGALVVLIVLAAWLRSRHDSADAQVARVCASLYRNAAHTAADTAAIDTSRTAVRGPDNTIVMSETCGQVRRTQRLE